VQSIPYGPNDLSVTGATCNPSRTGLMTSRHPASFPNYMDDFGLQNATTITDLLYAEGYSTGHMGKWHLGQENDPEQGTYSIEDIRIMSRSHNDPGGKDAVIFNSSIDFIEQHKDRPFYLNVWGHVAHSPVEPHPDLVREFCDVTVDRNDFGYWTQDKFADVDRLGGNVDDGMRHYLADLWGLDLQIGLLMDKLRELDLDKNTIVVFTSDHGAAPVMEDAQSLPTRMMGVMGGLRGAKHTFYEGGIRVPYIVRYPGHVPSGKVNHLSVISGFDLLPTIATLAKVKYDPLFFEGEDMSDVWLGSDRARTDPLFYSYSRTDGDRAMLYGKWKLHISKRDERALYDLSIDREERNNVYDLVNTTRLALEESLHRWEESLPKNYCRLDERYEPCQGGIPLPYDPTIPPVKVGPPANVTYEAVSYESAAVLAPSSIMYTPIPTQSVDGTVRNAPSVSICASSRSPTISSVPTAGPVPMVSTFNTSSDAFDLSLEEEEVEPSGGTKEETEIAYGNNTSSQLPSSAGSSLLHEGEWSKHIGACTSFLFCSAVLVFLY